MSHCIRHYEEPMEAECRTCGRPFCGRCLVFAFGPNKPPYCVGCALTASGVRNQHRVPVAAPAKPTVDKRAVRAQKKADRIEAKLQRKAAKHEKDAAAQEQAAVRTSSVPAPARLVTPSSRFTKPGSDPVIS